MLIIRRIFAPSLTKKKFFMKEEKNKAEEAEKFEKLKGFLSYEETAFDWESPDGSSDIISPEQYIKDYFKKSEKKS